jgi:hypothetical protein
MVSFMLTRCVPDAHGSTSWLCWYPCGGNVAINLFDCCLLTMNPIKIDITVGTWARKALLQHSHIQLNLCSHSMLEARQEPTDTPSFPGSIDIESTWSLVSEVEHRTTALLIISDYRSQPCIAQHV